MSKIYEALVKKEKAIGVIGLGYVGLPVALAMAKHCKVIGYDINPKRIEMLRNHQDPSKEIPPERFQGRDIYFTAEVEDLKKAHFFIVTVPTPIDEHKIPDLTPIKSATYTLTKVLKKGDYVVYESTVYPGCTEEICIPILEKETGMLCGKDFKVGYSPERTNPGDPEHTLETTVKVISACDQEALEEIEKVYALVVKAGLHKAPSIKVAEAAKVIENTQRDLNIALMNELSIIFNLMNINTYDVLDAAATKWNFHYYMPGLVGGHCIGVDPYYLTYKANELGYHSQVILAGRRINDQMGFYIGQQIIRKLIQLNKTIRGSRALVLGITFKENVSDIRNSKVVDMIRELKDFMMEVDVYDPRAEKEEVFQEYGIELIEKPQGPYDAIILAVIHEEFLRWQEEDFLKWANGPTLFVDIKGVFRGKIKKMQYWSL